MFISIFFLIINNHSSRNNLLLGKIKISTTLFTLYERVIIICLSTK